MDVGTVRERGEGHNTEMRQRGTQSTWGSSGMLGSQGEHGDGWDVRGSSGNAGTVWGHGDGQGMWRRWGILAQFRDRRSHVEDAVVTRGAQG